MEYAPLLHKPERKKVSAPLTQRPRGSVGLKKRLNAPRDSAGTDPQWDRYRLSLTIQPKLTVGNPNDRFESEADRVADQIMRMPDGGAAPDVTPFDGTTQRECSACASDLNVVQLESSADTQPAVTPHLAQGIAALRCGGGVPLSDGLRRRFYEPRFGRDFSKVRLHTGDQAGALAASIQAKAFTIGNDVVFGNQRFAPQTAAGKLLLAHELGHVVQQGGCRSYLQRQPLPTTTPEPRPTVGTQMMIRTARGGDLMLRVRPSDDRLLPDGSLNTVGDLSCGTRVTIVEQGGGGWYVVRGRVFVAPGREEERTGFVHGRFLQEPTQHGCGPAPQRKEPKAEEEVPEPPGTRPTPAPRPARCRVRHFSLTLGRWQSAWPNSSGEYSPTRPPGQSRGS